jgi:hypothetical protein
MDDTGEVRERESVEISVLKPHFGASVNMHIHFIILWLAGEDDYLVMLKDKGFISRNH